MAEPALKNLSTVRRDVAIDVLRGYCIASMVTGHIAAFSVIANALHVFPKFDGASGFVLLSGLVLGVVQSKRIESHGIARVTITTYRRAALIYLAQIALGVFGTCAALLIGWKHDIFPSDLESMPLVDLITGILTMNIVPPGGDVLRLYVMFLIIAPGIYLLMSKGQWVLCLLLSLALASIGYIFPVETSFSLFGGAPSASWASWQLLFVSAIVLGWYWRSSNIKSWIMSRSLMIFLTGAGITVVAAAISTFFPASDWIFNKYTFPPGRILVAYAVMASLYVVVTWSTEKLPRNFYRPLAVVGQRSLDSYIIQSLAVILIVGLLDLPSRSLITQVLAICVIFVCWIWAEIRSRNFLLH